MKICINALLCILVICSQTASAVSQQTKVDVEIVLAVDASGSVDRNELQLQLDGIAAAFRDEVVQHAIENGPMRQIMASMLIWSDAAFPKFPTEWHLVDSPASAENFAQVVESFGGTMAGVSAIGGGGTGLGDGLAYALNMIASNGIEATQRIVDVSGDGIETRPWNKGAVMLPEAHAAAVTHNVTVNGLAILTGDSALADWYRQNVAIGPGNFVMETIDFHDFRHAIRRKLLREFSGMPTSRENLGDHRSYASR